MLPVCYRPPLTLRLFMVLVGVGTLLIANDLWAMQNKGSGRKMRLETDTTEATAIGPSKMSGFNNLKAIMDERIVPPALQDFILRPSKIPGYLEVPGVIFPDGGKLGRRGDTSVLKATKMCNTFGSKCWGFIFHTKVSLVIFQASFAVPKKSRNTVYYIKKEFASFYEKGLATNLKCAVPVQEFVNERNGQERCQLPYINVFDKDILRISPRISSFNCTGRIYTTFKNSQLSLLDDVTAESGIDRVLGQPVRRASEFNSTLDDPETLTLDKRNVTFKDTDFIRVEVHFKDRSKPHVDYHASVVEKTEVNQRKPTGKYPLNIIMLIFDGTSSAHFQRMLPKSYNFLKTDLNAHIFKAYSVVGENTNPAMTALLTGRTVQGIRDKYGESRRGMPGAKTVDDWPFIFKEMKDRGFATMFSEDQPIYGAFSFGMMGFDQEPADHYGRTIWNLENTPVCISSVPQCVIQFNYTKSFMEAYSGRRKFGVTFLSDLCHRKVNLISGADQHLLRFLGSLKNEGLLNETILLVMADHGARFGDIRSVPQGKLESRLPFLSVTLPQWFEQQNPGLREALKENTEVITSPFDLHKTFEHLLSFPDLPPINGTSGASLFQRLNPNRTCADAGIPEHYCPCLTWKPVNQSHAHAHKSAETAVAHINSLLRSTALSASHCVVPIMLTKVTEAVQKLPKQSALTNKPQQLECYYQVQFQTSPANALFEATVRVTYTGTLEVVSEVDRVNRYGSQPDCIARELPGMRPYCFCK